jgi:hypothetical protein
MPIHEASKQPLGARAGPRNPNERRFAFEGHSGYSGRANESALTFRKSDRLEILERFVGADSAQ